MTVSLEAAYALSDQVTLRPEPFGALAYHYGTRRLVFLRSPDIVRVVETLDDYNSLAEALSAASIDQGRWPSFISALTNLESSEVICAR